MIKIYLSKEDLGDGREIILQHVSNPKKLPILKEVINTVRTLAFGENRFYKWQPKLEEFEGRTVTKVTVVSEKSLSLITEENRGNATPYNIEQIENFSLEKEIGTLEVLMSEGISRDKTQVVFQWVNNPERLRSRMIREMIDKIRTEKFGSEKPMVIQPKIENFEFKTVIKISMNGKEPKVNYINRFRQKPNDGIYKAPPSKLNLATSVGQAALLSDSLLRKKHLTSTLEEFAPGVFKEIAAKLNK